VDEHNPKASLASIGQELGEISIAGDDTKGGRRLYFVAEFVQSEDDG